MTINELKQDVAKLGFESYVEDQECFIASANRALSLIYVDRPVTKSAKISFRGPKVSSVHEFIEHPSGAVITIPFSGQAISFRTTGTGECSVTDFSGTNIIPLQSDNQLSKQLVKGSGYVTFKGDFYFTVSNFAVYEDLVSKKSTDIPEYTPYTEVDVSAICSDFRAFSGYPKDNKGNRVDFVTLSDGKARAPFDYRGELYLTYFRAPTPISADSMNKTVDISKECAPMLPYSPPPFFGSTMTQARRSII